MSETIKGYKGFDKDFKCRDFQYEVGKTYETDKAEICKSGFHFCESPLDVFVYYGPSERFAEVKGSGEFSKEKNGDTKVVCKSIHIEAEITLHSLLSSGVKFILDKVDWKTSKESNTGYSSAATNTGDSSAATNTGYSSAAINNGDRSAAINTGYRSAAINTGYSSAATNTGYRSAATNTGYSSAATNNGDSSAATVEGQESIACGLGYDNQARGALGCWLVLAERDDNYKIKSVKTIKVDGKKIKADTFYKLQKGKFVMVK